jgi:hypothetical protein
VISYDITKTNHIFTARHHDEPKPTGMVWICINNIDLSTLWCHKCNTSESHPEHLHEDLMRFVKMIEEKNSRKNNTTDHLMPETNDTSKTMAEPMIETRIVGESDHPSQDESHIKKPRPRPIILA